MGIAHVREVRTPRRPRGAATGRIAGAATALAMIAIALTAAGRSAAHDQSFSKAEIRWEGSRIAMTVELHPDDAAALMRAPKATAPTIAAIGGDSRLVARVREGLRLEANGAAIPLQFVGAAALPRAHRVALAFEGASSSPPATLGMAWSLFPATAQHETYVKVFAGGRLLRQDVLTAEHSRVLIYRRDRRGAAAAVARYVAEGIHHIFIGPDHILFIVGLVLLGGGVVRVLKIATAFTAAHSVTLALAALGVLRPPAGVVEPLIALSIVYVGIDNLRAHRAGRDWRTIIAFGFGLMHGFGFASVLGDVGLPREALAWSLLGFNLGVEAGQVCIVLLVAPALGLLAKRTPALAARVVTAASCGIVVAGGYWFVQRVAAAWA